MKRRETREVRIGELTIGGGNPIAVQSMTSTDTNDVEMSVKQTASLAHAGAAIVRLTVPSLSAVESLRRIRDCLRSGGVTVPLAADIHFNPEIALAAAGIVEKIRINPGNYAERPDRTGTDRSFENGAAKAAERFGPLVKQLKEKNVALRVGVNHGSLSARITERYGDTPEGMVESAFEYIRVCEKFDYHNIVVSLKSSIPAVTVAANLLFAERVDTGGGRYPLHLGVTEAGTGEEGKVRSAAGIGALLLRGLGDTIRVSLTGDPLPEIPAAREILEISAVAREEIEDGSFPAIARNVDALQIGPVRVGPGNPIAVVSNEGTDKEIDPPDILSVTDPAVVASFVKAGRAVLLIPSEPERSLAASALPPHGMLIRFPDDTVSSWPEIDRLLAAGPIVPFVELTAKRKGEVAGQIDLLLEALPLSVANGAGIAAPDGPASDLAFAVEKALHTRSLSWPQMLTVGREENALHAAIRLSPPLFGGVGHLIHARDHGPDIVWDLLHGTRRRITRAEFLSCPSCGRTLFDIEKAVARVREQTSHLKNIKIAVMGCIVNGPGEMADADFGYVGSGKGLVDLYEGRECVARSIRESEAVEGLVGLIRTRGRWIEPKR